MAHETDTQTPDQKLAEAIRTIRFGIKLAVPEPLLEWASATTWNEATTLSAPTAATIRGLLIKVAAASARMDSEHIETQYELSAQIRSLQESVVWLQTMARERGSELRELKSRVRRTSFERVLEVDMPGNQAAAAVAPTHTWHASGDVARPTAWQHITETSLDADEQGTAQVVV